MRLETYRGISKLQSSQRKNKVERGKAYALSSPVCVTPHLLIALSRSNQKVTPGSGGLGKPKVSHNSTIYSFHRFNTVFFSISYCTGGCMSSNGSWHWNRRSAICQEV